MWNDFVMWLSPLDSAQILRMVGAATGIVNFGVICYVLRKLPR